MSARITSPELEEWDESPPLYAEVDSEGCGDRHHVYSIWLRRQDAIDDIKRRYGSDEEASAEYTVVACRITVGFQVWNSYEPAPWEES